MKFYLSLLVISFLSISSVDAQIIHLTYVDQNNNTYRISQNEIEYDPITPAESSSGTYSGGAPWKKTISKDIFTTIRAKFDAIINDKTQLLETRTKPSILLDVQKGKMKSRTWFAKRNDDLDAYLRSLK